MKNNLVLIILLTLSLTAKSQFSYPIRSKDKLDIEDTMFVDELAAEIYEENSSCSELTINYASVRKMTCYNYIINFEVKCSEFVKMNVLYVVKDGFIISKCEEYKYN